LLTDMLAGGSSLDVFKFFGMKLERVLHCSDVLGELANNKIVELDLLGFSIAKPDIPATDGLFDDFYLPSLSSIALPSDNYPVRETVDRLARAVITTKSRDEDSATVTKKDAGLMIGQFAKYLCMFYLGAWFRDDLRKIVFSALVQVTVRLQSKKYLHSLEQEITSLLDEIDGVDFTGTRLPMSPSFQDLITIYAPARLVDYQNYAD